MNVNIGNIYGPWKIKNIINYTSDTVIAEVELLYYDIDIIKNKLHGINEWAIKIRESTCYASEDNKILKYKINECQYSIKIPNDDEYFHGNYNNYNWFVMDKHKSTINCVNNLDYKLLTKCIISFLKDLHCKKKLIHGDIKIVNILHDDDNFIVCDYESVSPMNNKDVCNFIDYSHYYYYGLGCEYNKPFYSYRMDLQAFGYILGNILSKKRYKFQIISDYYYGKKSTKNVHEYLEYKKIHDNYPDLVKEYLKLISEIDWFDINPPNENIYDNIIELINKYEKNEN